MNMSVYGRSSAKADSVRLERYLTSPDAVATIKEAGDSPMPKRAVRGARGRLLKSGGLADAGLRRCARARITL